MNRGGTSAPLREVLGRFEVARVSAIGPVHCEKASGDHGRRRLSQARRPDGVRASGMEASKRGCDRREHRAVRRSRDRRRPRPWKAGWIMAEPYTPNGTVQVDANL